MHYNIGMKKLFLALLFSLVSVHADAQSGDAPGSKEVDVLLNFLSGDWAFAFAIIATVVGLWTWLMKQHNWGLGLILLGVMVVSFPGLFEGIYNGSNEFLKSLGLSRDDVSIDGSAAGGSSHQIGRQ